MAELIVPEDYALVRFFMTNQGGHHCVSEIGVNTNAIIGQSAADALSAACGPAIRGTISDSCRYDGLAVSVTITGGLVQRFDSTSGVGTGGPTGNNTTPQVQFLAQKKTGFAGRAYRGRMYWPGVLENDVDATGLITVGKNTSNQTGYTAIFNALSSSPWAGPVLLHSDPLKPPTPIIQLLSSQKVATLRGRYDR